MGVEKKLLYLSERKILVPTDTVKINVINETKVCSDIFKFLNLVVFHNIINIHDLRSVEIDIRPQTSIASHYYYYTLKVLPGNTIYYTCKKSGSGSAEGITKYTICVCILNSQIMFE